MASRSSAWGPTLIGAGLGALVGYLYLTERGRRMRYRVEPWLDDLAGEMRRMRSIAVKARHVVDEGRQSIETVWHVARANAHDWDESDLGV